MFYVAYMYSILLLIYCEVRWVIGKPHVRAGFSHIIPGLNLWISKGFFTDLLEYCGGKTPGVL